jgi:hypothetical protein
MDIVRGAARVITRTADATMATAGAIGGAAVSGVVGGVQGTASGLRNGLSSGSHSIPAAALTVGVVGAAGLVDWPLLLTIGGTALVVHEISRRSDGQRAAAAPVPLKAVGGAASSRKTAPRKASATARRPRPTKTSRRRAPTSTS